MCNNQASEMKNFKALGEYIHKTHFQWFRLKEDKRCGKPKRHMTKFPRITY